MVAFDKKVLWIGFGSVGQCTLPLFLDLLKVKPEQLTVVDRPGPDLRAGAHHPRAPR